MTTTIGSRSLSGDTERAALVRHVEALIAQLYPPIDVDRRHDRRTPLPALFRLTPLDPARTPIDDESITVVGKNISRHGLSFYHEQPLAYRRAYIRLEHPGLGNFAAEIDISWCRFTKPGWYESGGRLVRLVRNRYPSADDCAFDSMQSTVAAAV